MAYLESGKMNRLLSASCLRDNGIAFCMLGRLFFFFSLSHALSLSTCVLSGT